MMRAILGREADRIADSGGFCTALWAHAAVLAAFLTVWGRSSGTQLMPRLTTYEQLLFVQASLMTLLLPWAAVRLVAGERGDAIVLTTARLGLPPSRILAARMAALSLALAIVVAAGLPLVVIAQRMSDVSTLRVLTDESALAACGILVAALVTALQQALASRSAVWLFATALSGVTMWSIRGTGIPMAVLALTMALAGVAGGLLVARRGDTSLRYLSESAA
jgi:hypothetical protein